MRVFIFSLLCCAAWCVVAAADQFDDVPAGHWAYGALDYLTSQGVLDGYPAGYFNGERALSRLEFAQAVSRLMLQVETTAAAPAEDCLVLTDNLRAEFSADIAALGQRSGELAEAAGQLEDRVVELESAANENDSRTDALKARIDGMKPGPEWNGLLLDRWDFSRQGDHERFAHRILFQLGYSNQIQENLQVAWRLRTNTGNAPNSSTWVLGQDGKTADIFLDRAYVKYSPHWLGSYATDCGQTCAPRMDIYAGMYPNITRDPYYMVFDTDFNFQGLGLVYHFNQDFQILSAANVLVERQGNTWFDDDTYLLTWELQHRNLGLPGLDAWLGCYSFERPGNLPDAYFKDNGVQGFDFDNDGAISGADRFSSNFRTLNCGLQYTWQCAYDRPLSVYGEYIANTESDARENIAAVNEQLSQDIRHDPSDDNGFLVGAQLGAAPQQPGDWMAYARYKEIGANAIIDGLGDAGVGGANVNSLELYYAWKWADSCTLGITYLMNKMHNAFNFAVPSSKDDQQILLVDWLFSF
jgi:hypothetical protein